MIGNILSSLNPFGEGISMPELRGGIDERRGEYHSATSSVEAIVHMTFPGLVESIDRPVTDTNTLGGKVTERVPVQPTMPAVKDVARGTIEAATYDERTRIDEIRREIDRAQGGQ